MTTPPGPLASDRFDHLVKHAQADVLEPTKDWVWALVKILWGSMTALPDPKAGPDKVGDFLALWGVVGSTALLVLGVLVSFLSSEDEKRQARVDEILEAAALTARRFLTAEKTRVDARKALDSAEEEHATADWAHLDADKARDLATRRARSVIGNGQVVADDTTSAFFVEEARVLAEEAFLAATRARADAAKSLDLATMRARSADAAARVMPADETLTVAAEEARRAAQGSRWRAELARDAAEESRVRAEQAISASAGLGR